MCLYFFSRLFNIMILTLFTRVYFTSTFHNRNLFLKIELPTAAIYTASSVKTVIPLLTLFGLLVSPDKNNVANVIAVMLK